MDLQKFREKLKEYRGRVGISQEELADAVYVHKSVLSEVLNRKNPPPTDLVHRIIQELAERRAIQGQAQVYELLELTDCEDFSSADWASPPLVDLTPSKPQLVVPEQEILYQDTVSLDAFDEPAAHARYLEKIHLCYGFLTLPTGAQQELPLQAAFQPLQLRSGITPAEDLAYEGRRAFLEELQREDEDLRNSETEREEPPIHTWEQRRPPAVVAKDGDDVLEKSLHQRTVILGSPGTGKTTLLRYFMVETAHKAEANLTDMVPIYISLPEFVNSGKTFQEYLPTILGLLGVDNRYSHTLWRAIEQGKAFLCLDTLEQVAPDRRRDVIAWINAQASGRGNVWVISSRFNEYNGGQLNRQFMEWELRPMTHNTRQKLAQALMPRLRQQAPTHAPLYDPDVFVNMLEKHPQTVNWGNNPLLFSLAAVAFSRSGTLPSSRATLYQEVIAAMVEARVSNRNRQALLRMVMASLALQLYQEKKRVLSRELLLRYLARIRRGQEENWRTDEIAQAIIDTGVLEVVAKDTYGFWHQTFAEYFAGVELATRLIQQDTAQEYRHLAWQKRTYSRWTEILRLMVGILIQEYRSLDGSRIAISWLYSLLEQRNAPQGDAGDLGLALAMQSLGEVGEIAALWKDTEWVQLEEKVAHTWVQALFEAVQLGQEGRRERLLRVAYEVGQLDPLTVELVVKQIVADFAAKKAQMRAVVLRALGTLGKFALVDLLVKSLSDKHSRVRDAAAQALAGLGRHAPLENLVVALESDSPAVRKAATQALGEMRQYAFTHFLVPGLIDEEWSVREATVRALGNLGEQAPVDNLVESLRDENSLVRFAAVEALGKLGERTPFDALISMVDDPWDLVCATAIEIMRDRTPIDKLIKAVLVLPQTSMLPTNFAQRAALEILGKLDEQRLFEALHTSGVYSSFDLQALLQLIRDSQRETSLEELIYCLYDSNEEMCLSAANILGRRKDWHIIEQFISSVDGAYRLLRVIAVQLLGSLEAYTPVNHLLTALADEYSEVRLEAAKALERLGERIPPEAVAVVKLLDDKDRRICTVSIRVLARLLEHLVVDFSLLEKLCLASSDAYPPLKRAAAACLEKLAASVTREQIALLLHHTNAAVRVAAMDTLGRDAPVDLLAGVFEDGDAKVREAAIRALGRHGWYAPVELLATALKDSNPFVSLAAVDALQRLGRWELLDDFYDEDGFIPPKMDNIDLDEVKPPGDIFSANERLFITQESNDKYAELLLQGPQENNLMGEIVVKLIRERASEEQLIAALDDEDNEVREKAIQALGERVPEERLIEALDDEHCRVRRAALQLLGDRTPTDKLLVALEDEFDIVYEVALQLFRKRETRIPLDQLIAGLESRSSTMRASAIRVLGTRAPMEKLRAALGDSAKDVRMAAVEALRQEYPEMLVSLIPELAAVLTKSGSSMVIGSAAESFITEIIGNLESASPLLIERLGQLLDWPYWEVRMKAAQALGKLRRNIPETTIRRLFELGNDPEAQTVRRATDDALAEILSLETGIEDED